MKDLNSYKGTLPYASELFGIYQPLLGWKSQRIAERFEKYRATVYDAVADRLLSAASPPVSVQVVNNTQNEPIGSILQIRRGIQVHNLQPMRFVHSPQPNIASKIDSAVARLLRHQIGAKVPEDWRDLIDYGRMAGLLNQVEKIVLNSALLEQHADVADYLKTYVNNTTSATDDTQAMMQSFFQRESTIAGYLTFLAVHNQSTLTELFFTQSKTDLLDVIKTDDPLLNFGTNRYEAILSPIGIIHLYREYFFEFDSFLGPSVGHVWLSPGGTVELIEINTRKVFTERTLELLAETVARSESAVTTQDELADAVKDENRNDIKFGFSNVASYSSPVVQDTASASFALDTAKTSSRETTHKHMRQQSEKLSSEIKRSFKTTFKTSTEVTDTSSKRYVLQNTTDKLVNYELRRKMRKVGVQVQDIGTQLCWTTFVDDPGRELGIAKLVHIAQPGDLDDLSQPEAVPMPQAIVDEVTIKMPFLAPTDVGTTIETSFPQSVICKHPQYTLIQVDLDSQGYDAKFSVQDLKSEDGSSSGTFTVHLDYGVFQDQRSLYIKARLLWGPSQAVKDSVNAENQNRVRVHTTEKARRFKEAFYSAARERIKLASKISSRPAEELREEERTVVYRSLISQLMRVGTHESKHVISELVRSIFDVDKMLYFVAPEWWAPRLHENGQHLNKEPSNARQTLQARKMALQSFGPSGLVAIDPKDIEELTHGTPIPAENIVDWGGAGEAGRNNYYITEDSEPARLGSSLGWLLQLDGDDLRNALLNSPWVKAVIPIRLGKEREAINWLQQSHVEGSEGLDAAYIASPDDPPELQSTRSHSEVTVRMALDYLIDKTQEFNQKGRTPILPNLADPADPRNHFAGSLPTEAVFEHGFYPLKGGVRFDQDGTEQAIFSQWMEILPTDQVVALQVEYDPKTLQIKDSAHS